MEYILFLASQVVKQLGYSIHHQLLLNFDLVIYIYVPQKVKDPRSDNKSLYILTFQQIKDDLLRSITMHVCFFLQFFSLPIFIYLFIALLIVKSRLDEGRIEDAFHFQIVSSSMQLRKTTLSFKEFGMCMKLSTAKFNLLDSIYI